MGNYEEIIAASRPQSRHRPMSRAARAAQFSAFAALRGYDSAVHETRRLTEERIELSEDRKAELDLIQQQLMPLAPNHPTVSLTYFLPDQRKSGGAYINVSGSLKKIDEINRQFVFTDGRSIPLDQIIDLSSPDLVSPLPSDTDPVPF